MNDLNEVIIEGKLVKDPDIKWIRNTDKAVCTFTLAVNKRYKDRTKNEWVEDTSFFLVETWRSVAEQCARYLTKGRGVRVVGELKQYRWNDETNGNQPRSRIYIIAEHVEFQPQKKNPLEPDVIKGSSEEQRVDSKEAIDVLNKEASENSESENEMN